MVAVSPNVNDIIKRMQNRYEIGTNSRFARHVILDDMQELVAEINRLASLCRIPAEATPEMISAARIFDNPDGMTFGHGISMADLPHAYKAMVSVAMRKDMA